ncbi:MAG TPA: PTS lactose/cellobiose transporter subunit IIA [Porticoccaceae bacterium]
MEVILAAGNARSMAYAALRAAKQGDFKAAEAHMACSRRELAKAHDVQTQLIQQEAAGHPAPLNLLMIHAQDHLMTAIAEQQLIQELIELHQKLGGFSQGE